MGMSILVACFMRIKISLSLSLSLSLCNGYLTVTAIVIIGGNSRHHVTPQLRDYLHWLRTRNASRSNSAYWCTRQSTALHQVIWTRCALQCPLFPNFLPSVPLLVVIRSYPEQGYNSATVHFVWPVRSPGTVYHWTFVRHLHYQRSQICSRHICSFVPTLLTVSRRQFIRRSNMARVTTLAMLLRLINCRFIIIIIIRSFCSIS